mmetsp:Transcript_58495/g.97071  ORF Transcript_58495/g.97071 Transcript_58495/m.97071 type:complete len:752 (+) Transcript_58495:259-2514(+)
MTYINNLKQMSRKNIDSIHTLIKIANHEGDILQNSWIEVIRTISQLERLQVVGRATNAGRNMENPTRSLDEQNALTIASQIDDVAINKIFANSVYLKQDGLATFMGYLCQVCIEEILNTHPRLYCLQKVVEVATDNLGPRIVCIWSCIANLFVEIGARGNPKIAGTAIDSLRQLVMKCLDRPDLIECQLQPEFLDPFYRIMANTNATPDMRDLILRCFEQIVLTKGVLLQGGWSSVFRALEVAAGDSNTEVVGLGWKMLHSILKESFTHLAECLVLSKAMHALYSFSCSDCAVNTNAMNYFPVVASSIACTTDTNPTIFNSQEAQAVWLSFLHDIALLSFHAKEETRKRAISILSTVLEEHGAQIAAQSWPSVFRTVLFDVISQPLWPEYNTHQAIAVPRSQWVATTASSSFRVLGQGFVQYFKLQAVAEMLPEVISFHVKMIKQPEQELIRVAMESYSFIFQTLCTDWSPKQWDTFAESLHSLLDASIILESHFLPYLSHSQEEWAVQHCPHSGHSNNSSFGSRKAFNEPQDVPSFASQPTLVAYQISQMYRQKLVVQFIESIFPTHFTGLSQGHVTSILNLLFKFYNSACFFNSSGLFKWRLALWVGGGPNIALLGAVLAEQSSTITLYFKVSFWMKECRGDDDSILNPLLNRCSDVLQHFVALDAQDKLSENGEENTLPTHLSEIHVLAPVLVLIISGLCGWDEQLFLRHVRKLHQMFLELILCNDRGIRQEVKRYFETWSGHLAKVC